MERTIESSIASEADERAGLHAIHEIEIAGDQELTGLPWDQTRHRRGNFEQRLRGKIRNSARVEAKKFLRTIVRRNQVDPKCAVGLNQDSGNGMPSRRLRLVGGV